MRLQLALMVLVLAGLGQAQAQTMTSRPESFGFWSAVCDGLGECTAWGVGATESAPGYVMVTDKADRRALRISAQDWSAKRPREGQRYEMTAQVVKASGGVLWSGTFRGRQGYGAPSALVRDAEVAAASAALARGAAVRIFMNGSPEPAAVISLNGSAAALLWTKSHARAPVNRPVVRRAAPVSQRNLPKARPSARGGCDAAEEETSTARIARGKVLWIVTCRTGYNNSAQLYLTDETGKLLPSPTIEADGIERLDQLEMDNIEYDPATRILRSTTWETHMGGCGSRTEWVWDGATFRRSMIAGFEGCHGVDTRYWPVRFRARVTGR